MLESSVLVRFVQDITKPMLDQYQHANIDVLLHLKKGLENFNFFTQ